MYKLFLVAVIPLFAVSCTTGRPVNYERVEHLVALTTEMGLDKLSEKYNKDDFNKAVRNADEVIVKVLLPTFQGAALDTLTVEAVDQIFKQLNSKVDKDVARIVQASLLIGFEFVNLPNNPSQKLGENHVKTITSTLLGLHEGLAAYLESQK